MSIHSASYSDNRGNALHRSPCGFEHKVRLVDHKVRLVEHKVRLVEHKMRLVAGHKSDAHSIIM